MRGVFGMVWRRGYVYPFQNRQTSNYSKHTLRVTSLPCIRIGRIRFARTVLKY